MEGNDYMAALHWHNGKTYLSFWFEPFSQDLIDIPGILYLVYGDARTLPVLFHHPHSTTALPLACVTLSVVALAAHPPAIIDRYPM